ANPIDCFLDDLGLPHGNAVQHRIEPGHPAAVPSQEDVVGPTIDTRDRGEAATAPTGVSGGRQAARITHASAYERHICAEQAGSDEFARGAGRDGVAGLVVDL